jgi:outer membrane protein TolC
VSASLLLSLVLTATPIKLEDVRVQSRNNTQALQSVLEQQRAAAGVTGSRSALLPQLSVGSSASRNFQGSSLSLGLIPDGTGGFIEEERVQTGSTRNAFSLSATLTQLIFDGRRWADLRQSGALSEAAKGEAVEQQATSELEAIRRFFVLYGQQSRIQVLRATVKRSEEQLERARALFEAGRAARSEAISAQVNLGNDRIALLQSERDLVVAQADLATWLAAPGTEEFEAVDPGILGVKPEAPPEYTALLEQARTQRPLLAALESRVRAASAGISAQRWGYFPNLAAQARYSRNGTTVDPVFTDPSLQNDLTVGLSLSWDLFSGFGTQAAVSQAQYARTRAQLDFAQAERDLQSEVRRALQTLATQIAATELATANREAAALGLAIEEERFKAGAGSTLEVRDAQLKLTQAELSLLTNRIDVENARYALQRATGMLSVRETK